MKEYIFKKKTFHSLYYQINNTHKDRSYVCDHCHEEMNIRQKKDTLLHRELLHLEKKTLNKKQWRSLT